MGICNGGNSEHQGAQCGVAVWQIEAFAEATQKFVAKRTSTHPTNLGFPSKAVFSLSTVEVLVSPTLPFLNRILEAMGRTKDAAAALFPLADKIVDLQGPHSMR
jgi:hypothetical protein